MTAGPAAAAFVIRSLTTHHGSSDGPAFVFNAPALVFVLVFFVIVGAVKWFARRGR